VGRCSRGCGDDATRGRDWVGLACEGGNTTCTSTLGFEDDTCSTPGLQHLSLLVVAASKFAASFGPVTRHLQRAAGDLTKPNAAANFVTSSWTSSFNIHRHASLHITPRHTLLQGAHIFVVHIQVNHRWLITSSICVLPNLSQPVLHTSLTESKLLKDIEPKKANTSYPSQQRLSNVHRYTHHRASRLSVHLTEQSRCKIFVTQSVLDVTNINTGIPPPPNSRSIMVARG
jgi:hypothetical protein